MKRIYLFAIISLIITSCSKDESTSENAVAKTKVLDFSSIEKMDQKIDEISAIKAEMESQTAQKYITQSSTSQSETSKNSISKNLKNYHSDRLKNIYDLREKTKFTSIQSIADEFNSLKVLDPNNANKLFLKHEKLLKKNEFNLAITIFENRTAEVINTDGKIILNGKETDFTNSSPQNNTGKYIGDEAMKTGLAVMTTDGIYRVYFTAGREKHKDDFGKTFFRYYTEFTSYIFDPTTGMNYYPAIFSANTASYAGFSQSGSNPLADFAFTMKFLSGYGSSSRQIGEQKWTAYQPEGGYLKASFVVGAQTSPYSSGQILSCDFQYNSSFLPK